jgi:serine/threonine protein kinase
VALPRDTPVSSSPPPAFGRYRVVHQLGAGVLGPVFRGYDPEHDRDVAIKAFSLDLTPEQACHLAADLGRLPTLGLGHPSIVAPYGAGAEGATAYLVEEYFVAESADVALKQYGPAPVPDAMRLIGQLGGALDFAAAAGVHHGALHPRDILVAPHEVRLTGLGVAAALERVGFQPPVRRSYAAPEQVTGGPVAGAADVFSLACVAFELVTGRRPTLSGDTVTVETTAIQAADAVALAEVFARALSARAEDRHPSALAFAAALKHALTGDPLQAGVETERPRPRRAGRGGRKTPPLALEPERDTPVAEEPHAVLPEDLALAEPLCSQAQPDVSAALRRQEALKEALVEPTGELPSSPVPGSTPLPSFLESYPKAVAEQPPSVREPETIHEPPIPEADSDRPEFDRRTDSTMAIPIVAPRVIEEPPGPQVLEPLPLCLGDLDPAAPDTLRAEAPMFSTSSLPPEPTASRLRTGLVPLLGMLLVGIFLGFPAGYFIAPRGQASTPVAPAPSTSSPQTPSVPVPVPASVPEAPPLAAPVIEASRQPVTPSRAATGGPARARARRDAARGAVGTGGPGAAAAGRKTTPARTRSAFEGSLMIVSKPAGASATLDGHPVGVTPLTLPAIAVGSHVIRLELAGYNVWSSSVQVTAGRQKKATASLERRPGG